MYDREAVVKTLRPPGMIAGASPAELESACQVQDRMLWRPMPQLRSLELAGCYLPARGIGGDYFDLLDLGRRLVGLVVGDIAGKGISAALMMASLQAIVRSRCGAQSSSLPGMLAAVNRLFCECTATSDFATLFYAEYNDATRVLSYVNCGHLPPLLFRRNRDVERLSATATVLGAFESWEGSEGKVHLEPGDLLIFYTDGLTEAAGTHAGEFGEAGLIRAIRRGQGSDPRLLFRSILRAVRAHSSGSLHDDLTLVVARCRARLGSLSHRSNRSHGSLPC